MDGEEGLAGVVGFPSVVGTGTSRVRTGGPSSLSLSGRVGLGSTLGGAALLGGVTQGRMAALVTTLVTGGGPAGDEAVEDGGGPGGRGGLAVGGVAQCWWAG